MMYPVYLHKYSVNNPYVFGSTSWPCENCHYENF